MKKKKWAVDVEKSIGWIMEFVRKYLKLEPDEKLVTLTFNKTFHTSQKFVHYQRYIYYNHMMFNIPIGLE